MNPLPNPPLANRRPHFIGPPVVWAGAVWLVGVGLDGAGRAVEVFADAADTAVEVTPAVLGLVHEASITASHLLQRGTAASAHAARLEPSASAEPGLLCLMLRRAAETEAEEGESVRWTHRYIDAARGAAAVTECLPSEDEVRLARDAWPDRQEEIGVGNPPSRVLP